jgi:hypothetical protein
MYVLLYGLLNDAADNSDRNASRDKIMAVMIQFVGNPWIPPYDLTKTMKNVSLQAEIWCTQAIVSKYLRRINWT